MKPDNRSTQLLTRMLLRVREEFARTKAGADDPRVAGTTPVETVKASPLATESATAAAEADDSAAPAIKTKEKVNR